MKQLVVAVRVVVVVFGRRGFVRLSDERDVVVRSCGVSSWSGFEEASRARDRQRKMELRAMASVEHRNRVREAWS